jgi:alpha-glucosidase
VFLLHPATPPWAVPDEKGLQLVLLSHDTWPEGRVFVRSLPDNEELLTPMQRDGQQGRLQRWRAHIAWDGGHGLQRYVFLVAAEATAETPAGLHWLAADGLHGQMPPEAVHFRHHRHGRPPAWVQDQVFYQVFPDRFARGNPAPFTPRQGVAAAWGTRPDPRHGGQQFYGGDLPGLTQRLPYLHEELGVTALYLNPVFSSPSNHRYDTSDYHQVDPALGGNEALAALRSATRARGMRLVLDAVVNHTGEHHAWRRQHPDWYAHDEHGQVLGWKGYGSLPVLDFAVPGVQQAIYGAPGSVLRHWLRPPHAIDGWRLDVVHMLGEGRGARHNARHLRRMRQAIREENPEAYVLGEHFSEATRWLQGDQEDGAMNYHGFTTPVRGWLAGLEVAGVRQRLSTAAFEAWMTRAMAAIPPANQLAQLNLLDSHDTPRLLSELGGDVARLQLAFTLLFTRPGAPCIYYGDEIGLEGGADPDCRRCFDWQREHWHAGLWAHVQGLARQRAQRAEWRAGATLTLAQGEDWLAYARYTPQAATVVVVNRGPATSVVLPLWRLPLAARHLSGPGGATAAAQGPAWALPVAAGRSALLFIDT